MPKILSDSHDSFIKNYFETAKSKIFEKKRLVIAKDKDGFIIPVYLLLKTIPKLNEGLTFMGFLRKIEKTSPFF